MDDRYDPQEDESRRSSGHVTRKEVIIVGIALVILAFLLFPVFQNMLAQRHKYVCTDNMSKIMKAINLYAEDNTGRLPPAYTADNVYAPEVLDGKVYSWASLLTPMIDKKDGFECPAAHKEEMVHNDNGRAGMIRSAYGMFAPMSATPLEEIANLSQSVLIAETANQGARKTYNPTPMIGASGQPVPDGIVIGFDNSNFSPDDQANVFELSKHATRMAFYDTAGKEFIETGATRHPGGIHVLFADGHIATVKPPFAEIRRTGKKNGEIIESWSIP